jgi:Uma2 family endonuclease
MGPSIDVNFSPLARRYTLEELWTLERETHASYDLIDGCLFLAPLPVPPHGDVAFRMTKSLVWFMDENHTEGNLYFPHEAICLDERATYIEPDLMYVSRELRQKMGTKRTSADIVFEFQSRSTSVYDRTTKADTYLALGVRELWLIDPFTETIEVRHAGKVGEILIWRISKYSRGQHAQSLVLEGYQVSVDELFADLTQE